MLNPSQVNALSSFRLLVGDFRVALEYVEPDTRNWHTFSQRLFALLLRACTEFENIAKICAAEKSISLPNQSTIKDYSTLLDAYDLRDFKVGLVEFTPSGTVVNPLAGWDATPHGLNWYRDYNNAKHSRSANFDRANLENVTLAVAGCFALLVASDIIETDVERHVHLDGRRLVFSYTDYPFSSEVKDTNSLIDIAGKRKS